jgi:hypothetical protein
VSSPFFLRFKAQPVTQRNTTSRAPGVRAGTQQLFCRLGEPGKVFLGPCESRGNSTVGIAQQGHPAGVRGREEAGEVSMVPTISPLKMLGCFTLCEARPHRPAPRFRLAPGPGQESIASPHGRWMAKRVGASCAALPGILRGLGAGDHRDPGWPWARGCRGATSIAAGNPGLAFREESGASGHTAPRPPPMAVSDGDAAGGLRGSLRGNPGLSAACHSAPWPSAALQSLGSRWRPPHGVGNPESS